MIQCLFPSLTRAYDNNGRCPRQKFVFCLLMIKVTYKATQFSFRGVESSLAFHIVSEKSYDIIVNDTVDALKKNCPKTSLTFLNLRMVL